MFDQLGEVLDGLEQPGTGAELRALVQAHERLAAITAAAVGAFEACGSFGDDGAVTMAAWLRTECRMDPTSAHRLTSEGRRLHALPALRDAATSGRLSGGQVQVVLRAVPGRHVGRFAEHEADLIPTLEHLDIADTATVLREWRQRADALDDTPPPAEHDNQVHLTRTLEHRGEVRASLDADRTATLEAALRAGDPGDRTLSLAQRRADALDTVCRFFLDHQAKVTGRRHRPHLNVVCRLDETGNLRDGHYLDTGAPVSDHELRVLACDAVLHRVLVDSRSVLLDYGTSIPVPTISLYNALVVRDQGCRFPGCDRPANWCDAHHVVNRSKHGPTAITNLVLLCRRHHRLLHRDGWNAHLHPEGTFVVTSPDGTKRTSDPPLTAQTQHHHRLPIAV